MCVINCCNANNKWMKYCANIIYIKKMPAFCCFAAKCIFAKRFCRSMIGVLLLKYLVFFFFVVVFVKCFFFTLGFYRWMIGVWWSGIFLTLKVLPFGAVIFAIGYILFGSFAAWWLVSCCGVKCCFAVGWLYTVATLKWIIHCMRLVIREVCDG